MRERRRILITGGSGFVGPHLCRALRRRDPTSLVVVTSHTENETPQWGRELDLDWRFLDVTDPASVHETIAESAPTHVLHLAAQSHVPTAHKHPVATWQVNVMGTVNLLEAVRRHSPETGFVFVASGDMYGRSFEPDKALTEYVAPQPENPYSASKAAAELAVRQYGFRGLRTVCLRSFNHVGPGQSADFVIAAFARQIARIEQGLQPAELRVGNLDAWRDFTDVRDVVDAYVAVLENLAQLEPGAVFNVCSAAPHQIRGVLDELIALSDHKINVELDKERLRPSDTPYAAGDAGRLRDAVGWRPRLAWRQTLSDVLDDWRGRVARSERT